MPSVICLPRAVLGVGEHAHYHMPLPPGPLQKASYGLVLAEILHGAQVCKDHSPSTMNGTRKMCMFHLLGHGVPSPRMHTLPSFAPAIILLLIQFLFSECALACHPQLLYSGLPVGQEHCHLAVANMCHPGSVTCHPSPATQGLSPHLLACLYKHRICSHAECGPHPSSFLLRVHVHILTCIYLHKVLHRLGRVLLANT